jgi:hypothetical protein
MRLRAADWFHQLRRPDGMARDFIEIRQAIDAIDHAIEELEEAEEADYDQEE